MAVLTSQQRDNLQRSQFAMGGGRYPINDINHARNALARASGKPEEAAIRASVYAKFPQLRKSAQKKRVPRYA